MQSIVPRSALDGVRSGVQPNLKQHNIRRERIKVKLLQELNELLELYGSGFIPNLNFIKDNGYGLERLRSNSNPWLIYLPNAFIWLVNSAFVFQVYFSPALIH